MSQANLFWFDNVEIRPAPWTGLNWITTVISVPDVKKARDLYISVFNLVSIFDLPDPKSHELITTRLRYRGTNFLLTKQGGIDSDLNSPATNQGPPTNLFYIYVDDVDATYKRALEAGMTSIFKPSETPWGDYRGRVCCPDGYIWDIAVRISKGGK